MVLFKCLSASTRCDWVPPPPPRCRLCLQEYQLPVATYGTRWNADKLPAMYATVNG